MAARPTHLERITAYFEACGTGSASDIAKHFTTDAAVSYTHLTLPTIYPV